MKNSITILLVFIVFSVSCREKEDLIPFQHLPWLMEQIEVLEKSDLSPYFYLVQAKYQGETVYYFGNCCPFCNSAPPDVYDEAGNFVGNILSLDSDKLVDHEKIWKSENHQCQD